MTNLIIILLVAIILIGVFFYWKNPKKIKEIKKVSDLIISQVSIDAKNKNTQNKGGFLDQKENTGTKQKVMNWKKVNSYEDDINNFYKQKINQQQEEQNFNDLKNTIEDAPQNLTEIQKIKNNVTLLLVDDSLVVRKYVHDLLIKNDYQIVLKNDGQKAIDYLSSTKEKPDLIITDIEMPNMNGFELIEKIRGKEMFQHIPILVISAYASHHLELMEKGQIQGFIKKPFNDEDLLFQLNYLLENQI